MECKIKELLKISFLCLAFIFMLTSCEKNDTSMIDEIQQEKKINRISFGDFYSNITHNNQYKNLEKHFDINKNSNQKLQNRISERGL